MRMESDEFDFLAPAYVRGFLRTYARYLRVNPEPLTEEFDRRFGTGRLDTASIVALERRAQKAPKERKKFSSWGLAAVFATGLLALLAFVGVLSGPGNEPRRGVALDGGSPSPSQEASPTVSPTPTATSSPAEIAFDEGIDVRIVASEARCWVYATDENGDVLENGTLEVGQSTTLFATQEMTLIFGYPPGVELIVNDVNLGAPSEEPGRFVLHLPEDVNGLQL